MWKGFMTEEEAEKWFNSITKTQIEKHHKQAEAAKKRKEEKKKLKKYEIFLDPEHSKFLDEFCRFHKISASDFVTESIDVDIIGE